MLDNYKMEIESNGMKFDFVVFQAAQSDDFCIFRVQDISLNKKLQSEDIYVHFNLSKTLTTFTGRSEKDYAIKIIENRIWQMREKWLT